MARDRIDELFGDVRIPGTTPQRSAKALRDLPTEPKSSFTEAAESEDAVGDEVVEWFNNTRYKRTYKVGGVEREFYTVSALLEAVGVPYITLRSWERRGVFPQAPFRSPQPAEGRLAGDRLYTKEHIEGIIDAAVALGMQRGKIRGSQEFRRSVWALWQRLLVKEK